MPTESDNPNSTANNRPPDSKQPWPFPFNILKEEWPEVKRVKLSFVLCAIAFLLLGGFAVWILFGQFIIPGKDATIQSFQIKAETPTERVIYVTNYIPQTMWYLKIDKIEYTKWSSAAPLIAPPFRIEAVVNSQNFSFPISQMYYFQLKDSIEPNQAYPLQIEQNQYVIQFYAVALRKNFFSTNYITSSNVVAILSSKTERFGIKNLPAKGTNGIPVSIPNSDESVAEIKIIYEITSN